MSGSLLQRARFIAQLALTLAKRALPSPVGTADATNDPDEALIDALQTGDIAMAQNRVCRPLFCVVLETCGLTLVRRFLAQGASAQPNIPLADLAASAGLD
jgi:hypothetical protein